MTDVPRPRGVQLSPLLDEPDEFGSAIATAIVWRKFGHVLRVHHFFVGDVFKMPISREARVA